MNFLEQDLESIIYKTPNDILRSRGLDIIDGHKKRQVNFKDFGIADLVTINKSENGTFVINVFELKKEEINTSTLFQALNYTTAISLYLMHKQDKCSYYRKYDFDIKITLIGKKYTKNDCIIRFPLVFSKNLNLFTYSYDFNGIHFNKFIP